MNAEQESEWEAERAEWVYLPMTEKPGMFQTWPEFWRFLLYVGGTILAAAIVGFGLACWEHGKVVRLW